MAGAGPLGNEISQGQQQKLFSVGLLYPGPQGERALLTNLCGLGRQFGPLFLKLTAERPAARALGMSAWQGLLEHGSLPPEGRLPPVFTIGWTIEPVHANKTCELRGLQLMR